MHFFVKFNSKSVVPSNMKPIRPARRCASVDRRIQQILNAVLSSGAPTGVSVLRLTVAVAPLK